jgi:hypothetical protein
MRGARGVFLDGLSLQPVHSVRHFAQWSYEILARVKLRNSDRKQKLAGTSRSLVMIFGGRPDFKHQPSTQLKSESC